MAIYPRISFTGEIHTNKITRDNAMLTKVGMTRLKKLVMKLAQPGDDEWNVLIQTTVTEINRLIEMRFS